MAFDFPFLLIPAALYLGQKPGPAFGFIDPNFDQTWRSDVTMLVADVMCLAQTRGQRFVVVGQLRDHVQRLDVFRIVIEYALSARNVADRSQRKSSDLSNSLRDWIGHGEKLAGVFVEE